jgi:pimeloyl-ACP methyl ester carboxylesterase
LPLSMGKVFQRDIPNSKLFVIDECGHHPMEEKPEELVEAMENFWSDLKK